MKRKGVLFLVVIISTIFIFSVGIFAVTSISNPNEVMSYIVGIIDTLPTNADANGDNHVNILDVIKIMMELNSSIGIEITGQDGRKITDGDVIEIKKETHYQLSWMLLPDNTSENISWNSTDNSVAFVNEGIVYAISNGNADITATADNGSTISFTVVVYEMIEEQVISKWDCGSGFYLDNSLTFDSEHDWSVKWRFQVPSGTDINIMGQSDTGNDSLDTEGNISLIWSDSDNCSLVFNPQEGEKITLNYTFYSFLNNDMNIWELSYSTEENMLMLEALTEDDSEVFRSEVAKIRASDFSLTVTNLFGIQNSEEEIGLNGSVDYIAVDCISYTRVG